MSGIVSDATAAVTAVGSVLSSVFITPYRAIGPEIAGSPAGASYFIADVTESEEHRDELFITEHPIQAGANISDHAYKRPAQVQLSLGWSNSKFTNFDPYYINKVYIGLLRFQSDRAPFALYTGKRVYYNMLISNLTVQTDAENEFVLRLQATCVQVFIVNTQTTSISTNSNNQSNPQSTQPTTNNGTQTTSPAPNVNSTSYSNAFGSSASTGNVSSVPVSSLA